MAQDHHDMVAFDQRNDEDEEQEVLRYPVVLLNDLREEEDRNNDDNSIIEIENLDDDDDHDDDHDDLVLVQEPSAAVQSAWRAFLESQDYELRLESLRLTPICVQFLMDRIELLPNSRRPRKLCLSHVTFLSRNDGEDEDAPFLALLDDDFRTIPEAAKWFADGILLENCGHWISLEIEDNINNPRLSSATCRMLLQKLLHTSWTSSLHRLRLRGVDLRSPSSTIECSGSSLKRSNAAKLLRAVLRAHSATLLELDLENCRFHNTHTQNEDDDITHLYAGLSSLSALESLSIYECSLNDELMGGLVRSLSLAAQKGGPVLPLKQVLLYDNHITSASFAVFAQLLHNHPQLQHLKLAFWGRQQELSANNEEPQDQASSFHPNPDPEDGCRPLSKFNRVLANHMGLEKLDIFCKNTSAADVVEWLHVFEDNESLLEFRFGVFCLKRQWDDKKNHRKGIATTSLEMKYGMLAGNNASELETLFHGIASLRQLRQLILNQCHFYSPKVGRAFAQALLQRTTSTARTEWDGGMEDLRLHSCRFHLETWEQVVLGGLGGRNCQTLRTLYLAGCRVDDAMMTILSQSLVFNTSLQYLDLSWNNLTVESLGRLTSILRNCHQLGTLTLSHNELLFHRPGVDHDNQGAVLAFLGTLTQHEKLHNLDLAVCGLVTPLSISLLKAWESKVVGIDADAASSQKHNRNGSGLHLGFASIERRSIETNHHGGSADYGGTDGVQVFCGVRAGNRQLLFPLLTALCDMAQLVSLEFCGTDLRGATAGHRLQSVLQSPKLSSLLELNIYGVENPPVNQDTMEHLVVGLRGHKTLETLRLGGCSLRDGLFGLLATNLIAERGTTRSPLKHLFLRYNFLTAESLGPLALVVSKLDLDGLDLASNETLFLCNRQELMPFVKAISRHRTLKRLCLCHCGVQGHVARRLFRALESHSSLHDLDVGGNEIQLSDDFTWLESMSRWTTIYKLKIPRGFRSEPQWEHFLFQLSRNTSIQELLCEQGQMPLVQTSYEHAMDGCRIKDPRITSLMQRNYLLSKGMKSVTNQNLFNPSLVPHLLRRLGSNHGEGTPINSLLKQKATELYSFAAA